jgi:hypothetical protein
VTTAPGRLTRGLRLDHGEKRAALEALGWLVLAQLALLLLPYRTIRRRVEALRPRSAAAPLTPEACGRAIARASVLFPVARCLAQAIAADCMLRRAGRETHLRLGVGFDDEHVFRAHAWLESGGTIVTGNLRGDGGRGPSGVL